MNSFVLYLTFQALLLSREIQGQCHGNGSCVCHCTNGCITCLPGWSGSTTNCCQKSNTFYPFHGLISEKTLLDGDLSTYYQNNSVPPFVRILFPTDIEISQVDITLFLENGVTYTVYVKREPFKRVSSVTCNKFTHDDVGEKKTVTVKCNPPLQGTIIEIVASISPRSILKVFEIERFECSNGTYGENCTGICSAGCNKLCDKKTGACICKSSFWGSFCNETCPLHCDQNVCNSTTGDCYNCIPGYYGINCDNYCSVGCQGSCNMRSGICICKPGFHSANCSLQCSSNCLNRECLQETGHCRSCNDGAYGTFCNRSCLGNCSGQCEKRSGICGRCTKRKYSTYCNQTCPINCEGAYCERNTGECENCINNTYGPYCEHTCPSNCEGTYCDRNTGKCENCLINTYGSYCEQTCPSNCEGGVCERYSGECPKCNKGYMGKICNETCPENCEYCDQDGFRCNRCVNGWFGLKCDQNCSLNCGGNGSCDIMTGNCHICSAGSFGTSCTEKCSEFCDSSKLCNIKTGQCQNCKPGRYGEYCLELCDSHCKNFTCFSNQSCMYGCEDGWFGNLCENQCSAAVSSCDRCEPSNTMSLVCRHCADSWYLKGSKCFECPENCSSCFSDVKCLECKNNLFFGEICNMTCNKDCLNKTCDITGNCILGCDNSKYGIRCEQDCPIGCKTCNNASLCYDCKDCYFMESDLCYEVSQNCEKCKADTICKDCECPDSQSCRNKDQDVKMSTLIAAVVPIPILILVSILVFCLVIGLMKRKWKTRSMPKDQNTQLPLPMRTGHFYENVEASVYNTRGSQALLEEINPDENSTEAESNDMENPVYVNVNMTSISVKRLWEYKLQNTAIDIIHTEFQNLPTGLLLRSTEAKKSENKERNRYKHVYPYDANRVVLSEDSERCKNSYINASYINGLEVPKEYIAAQGPFTDQTVTDFWRMVWNENVNTIVILTNLEENGVKKCKKYWPSTENMYGDIKLKTLSSASLTCYKVRVFQLTTENEVRTVEQFHFTAWPDKGVPSTVNSILDFRKKVRSKADITGPIVVHCSAGIGRTGTFIALDFLINQGQKDGKVDVISCVSNLRYQRTHLVQTVEQYIYLYSALTKELTGKESGIQENEFMTYYSQMKRIDQSTGKTFMEEEFNLIEKLVPEFDENRYQTAKALNNSHKNRHSNILADDNFRIHQDSDYINAIALPSAQQKFGYIITNTPLSETVDNFFSMVADHDVYIIVQLDNDADEVFGTRCQRKNETFPHNTFELNPREKTTFGFFEVLTCHLQDDHALISRAVGLYRGRFWNENHVVPKDFQPMISLVEEILNQRRKENGKPVVVVCRDGAQRSGLFCVLANLVEQLQLSGSVDILQTVLNVRHRRPQIVTCLEQLEYIYDFIKKYFESANKV